MKTYRLAWVMVIPAVGIWLVPLLLLGVVTATQGQDAPEAGAQAAPEAGVQVLTRGPVHEAFAEASPVLGAMAGATAGVVITKAPPDPILELPPDQRPEGANVAWIPGYWSWDDDRSDFIWVSGVWRDLPPGRQWVPGYWTPVAGGSQWISGFWGDAAKTEVTYLPPPPEPLEAGPSSPAPAPSNLWTPGCWVWQDTRYAWQPGYWVAQQPNWIWAPAHYTWTPRGYVYVSSYWDRDIVHRGVMFAPVYYDQPVYARASYSYSPSIVIDLGVIAACLFVQPRSNHYYYGDYYDARYDTRGIYPWYSKQLRRYGDDPIYVNYRATQLGRDPNWDAHMDEQYTYRREHVDARPPQTLALQVHLISTHKAGVPGNVIIGKSLAEAAQSRALPLRLTSLNMDERKQIETRGQEVRKFQLERAKLESAPAATGKSEKAGANAQPVTLRMSASPVRAKPLGKVENGNAPPPMPTTSKAPAVTGKNRQGSHHKIEAKTATPASQKKPGRAEVSPVRGASAPANEKPKRVEPKPEANKSESTPHTMAPKPGPAKRETAPEKTESKSQAAQAVETPKPRKAEARSEVKSKPAQAQNKPKAPEPKRESPKSEAPKPEVRPQKTNPKAQQQHQATETKKQNGKPEKTFGKENNKNKKDE